MRTATLVLPVLILCCAFPAFGQASPPAPFETSYEVIVPGLIGNSPYTLEFRSANLRVEVRDLIMGPGAANDVPTPARTVMELRGGSIVTVINGQRTRRAQGEIWRISPGDRLSLENPYDVAVIRAMSVFEGSR
jgi:hypothetical protein